MHWPFCEAKCPYCDFNSHVARQIDESAFVRAYVSEIRRIAAMTPGRLLNSIFFGGGTPSLMHPDTVAAVIEAARDAWTFANDIEITLEANPGSIEAERFRGYRDAGVNRVSMGMQAMNDADLRRLGRIHTADEALRAFDIARDCFDRVSFDLIYARQDQTLSDWESELKKALNLAIDHVSLYQLTVEDGTAFGDRHAIGKLRGLPDEDRAADMYDLTQEICDAHGMPAYEVSNHARPGAESRHNLIYWRGGDYAGIGPGAHARLTLNGQRVAIDCAKAPALWLADVDAGTGERARTHLSHQDQIDEYVMMGLRVVEGLDLERLGGLNLPANQISDLQEMGLLDQAGSILKVTPSGRPVLNAIIRELLTG